MGVSPTAANTQVQADSMAKRGLDLVLSFVGLLVSFPLWIITAILIKLEDGQSVFYKQRRFGLGGNAFHLLKFRTMRPDADIDGIHSAVEDDARVTRVGRLLRATGIDELPQLWNILVGSMSLVGPRALAVGEAIRNPDGSVVRFEEIPGFRERLSVKPGLTGLATIYVAKDADPLEKLEIDLRYIREQSFWLDVRLILLSLWISVRGKWETRGSKL